MRLEATIRTKRWDEPPDADDGTRILVTRYRPRALRKEHETWDEWCRHLGPSAELHAQFYGKGCAPIAWSRYVLRYRREMAQKAALIADLAARVLSGETLTFLCSAQCKDPGKCHRTLLRDLVHAKVRLAVSPRRRSRSTSKAVA